MIQKDEQMSLRFKPKPKIERLLSITIFVKRWIVLLQFIFNLLIKFCNLLKKQLYFWNFSPTSLKLLKAHLHQVMHYRMHMLKAALTQANTSLRWLDIVIWVQRNEALEMQGKTNHQTPTAMKSTSCISLQLHCF